MNQYFTILFAFLVSGLVIGPTKCWSVFFIQYQLSLNASARDASTVSSFLYAAMFLSGPVATILINKFGYRQTILLGTSLAASGTIACSFATNMAMVDATAGILVGIGCGLANIPTLALVSQMFEAKRSLVNNIVTTGSATISIPLSPLIQCFIDYYGWRGSFLLLGGIVLNAVPLSLLLVTRKINSSAAQGRKLIDLNLLKTLSFPLYAIGTAFHVSSITSVLIYLVRYAQEQGVEDYKAATLASVYSFVDLSIRPISGYLTTLSHIGPIPIRRSYFFAGVLCLRSVVASMFPFATDFYGILIATAAFAISVGCSGALSVTVLSDLYGADTLVSSLGLRAVAVGMISLLTPLIIGALIDSTESYKVPFYSSALLSLVASLLIVIAQKLAPPLEKKNEITKKEMNCAEEGINNKTTVSEETPIDNTVL